MIVKRVLRHIHAGLTYIRDDPYKSSMMENKQTRTDVSSCTLMVSVLLARFYEL
jgi:hypothetical protein